MFGAATIVWSVGAFFLVPDTPGCARFLSKEDRVKAMARVEENMTGIKSNTFKWYQCREALCDVKAWFIVALVLASDIPNGAINAVSGYKTYFRAKLMRQYFAIIVKGFGFSTLNTLLLQCVPYLFQLFFVLVAAIGSSRLRNCRTYFGALYFAISITGAAMVRYLPANMQWGRYFGIILTNAYTGSFPLTMSLVSGNFGGFTKKATVNAMVRII